MAEPEKVKSAAPCKYCGKGYKFFKVLGNPGYCSKLSCERLAMRDGL